MERYVRCNNKGFYRYVSSRRKTKENFAPLLDRARTLKTKELEKLEVLSACFALVFTGRVYFRIS